MLLSAAATSMVSPRTRPPCAACRPPSPPRRSLAHPQAPERGGGYADARRVVDTVLEKLCPPLRGRGIRNRVHTQPHAHTQTWARARTHTHTALVRRPTTPAQPSPQPPPASRPRRLEAPPARPNGVAAPRPTPWSGSPAADACRTRTSLARLRAAATRPPLLICVCAGGPLASSLDCSSRHPPPPRSGSRLPSSRRLLSAAPFPAPLPPARASWQHEAARSRLSGP